MSSHFSGLFVVAVTEVYRPIISMSSHSPSLPEPIPAAPPSLHRVDVAVTVPPLMVILPHFAKAPEPIPAPPHVPAPDIALHYRL